MFKSLTIVRIMQSTKLKTVLKLNVLQWNFIRTTAVRSATVNTTEEVQAPLKSWKEIPGPSSLPIVGPILHFLPGRALSDLNILDDVLYKTYGPIVRLESVFGGPTFIFLFDPEACAQVLRGENWMPIRPGFDSLEYYRKKHKKTQAEQQKMSGLITDHGENWKEFRSTINPVMLQPKIIKLYSNVLEEVADDMVKRMKSIRDEDYKLQGDFDVEMNLWALESIGVVALGGRLRCFNRDLAENSPERRLIQCVHDLFTTANELDFKPSLWRYFPTKAFTKAMLLYKEQEDLAKFFIRKARKDLEQNKKSDSEKAVLEKLLEINEEIAVIMACDMLFAGVDTAANTITATLYLLAKNQDKQEKLRELLKTKDSDETIRYVKACIKEGLRMMPVVSGNVRQATKDYDILGYKIPKGINIAFHHQYMSSMESQFPKPKEYIPERWLDKNHPLYHGKAHPFAYSPFGFGVRMCAGRRIAELELETFLAKVIESFKVEWFGGPPKIQASSLNYIKGPFNFRFKDV
ncbi:cytochrome P450 CYP12A2-like [Hyposmocoma kahamanoa]|uniref:cytochrome P450 CYP12A2-like n=1 Tax=Hyposmocoma kahamanoa TaxID=1477025 RepID=UPI000E6D81AF|nr:cytochrome P450 CYP12A2-like [Hyposmocoma kahamanoa]